MNFIEQYQIDKVLCKKIIDYFESASNKTSGTNGYSVNTSIKKSTDLVFDSPLLVQYINELAECTELYKKKYIYCDIGHEQWSIFPEINIQRYLPGEGYYKLHSERMTGYGEVARRHLVFMTYLNDVTDEGETFFYYQGLKVKPKTGLTLIWPAEWTHTHNGITSMTQTKYIVTGWMSYEPHKPFNILSMAPLK